LTDEAQTALSKDPVRTAQ